MRIYSKWTSTKSHGIALATVMVIALLSSLVHVSLHDIDHSGTGPPGHYECQLSQLPGALLPVLQIPPVAFGAVLLLISILSSPSTPTTNWAWSARAPPQ